MSDVAIRVRGLGKKYRIGRAASVSLRNRVAGSLRALGRSFRTRHDDDVDAFWALRDVSFDIGHGEVVGFIGHNGAGKSTALKILSRITDPTEGEVDLHGRVGSLLEVGTGFHPDLTGRENIYLSGALLGMRRREIRRKFDEIVDFAGVPAFLDTPVKWYSSGMYMRLAFAVAAHLETEIVLVDEVLAVGDEEFQKKCLGKMGDVARQGRTVVFVSHNLPALQRLCPTSLLFEKGRVIAAGPSAEVIRKYLRVTDQPTLDWRRNASSPPGTDAWFERVYVANERNEPVTAVGTNDQVRIGLEFVVRAVPAELQVSIGLMDTRSGEFVFASSPQDSGAESPRQPGCYRAFVQLPSDLFMAREYAIRTVLWTPAGGAIESRDVLAFSAVPTASLSNSTPGGRVGLIALRCEWVVERLSDVPSAVHAPGEDLRGAAVSQVTSP